MSTKPTVRFHTIDGQIIWLWGKANIIPIDHPIEKFNGKETTTSWPLDPSIVGTQPSTFETKNTIYVRDDS